MKIVLISTNFSPELTGTGKYSGEMVDWLANHGHEVRTVCAPPYYPDWQVHKKFSAWQYKISNKHNQCIYRCPIWVPVKPTAVKRLFHLSSFVFSSVPIVCRLVFWRPDIVICVEPPLFNSVNALLMAKLSGAKALLHIQDFEIDAAFGANILKAPRLKKVFNAVECFLMRHFDYCSTISDAMLERLSDKKIDADKRFLFPNWVDISLIYPLQRTSLYRRELSISEHKTVVLYSGNMGEKQGLQIIISAARELVNDNILFIMCGSGSALPALQKSAEGLENIIWLELQPLEQLNELLNVADIHLLPQQADMADLVMPSKLTGMLSSGRPVIATAREGTQVAKVVRNCGIVVKPNDVSAFTSAIWHLSVESKLRQELGAKARDYAEEHLQYDVILQNFQQKLQSIVQKKRTNSSN